MQNILDVLNSKIYLLIISVTLIILLILYILNTIKLSKLRKSYKEFMKRLGNGNSIDEMLKKYIESVQNVEKQNSKLVSYCDKLDTEKNRCLQKVGLVRYNAFKDTGSDLSFALAILDEYNNGIVLNGIYSREMSNIYAKPIENGKSTYMLSEEEKDAINKAMDYKY